MEFWPTTVAILFALALVSHGYARFLNQKHIHDWYWPRRVWITVAGGNTIIGIALGAFCAVGTLPWITLAIYAVCQVFAGAPIAHWQHQQNKEREFEDRQHEADRKRREEKRNATTRPPRENRP